MFLTDSAEDANLIRKWSTQSRESAPWYHHKDLGYNYRMSNIIAGTIRGQIPYLDQHIVQKKEIYDFYAEGLKNLPVKMNPVPNEVKANYWMSCLTLNDSCQCRYQREDAETWYLPEEGKTCPDEILGILNYFNIEGRPLWKPMHMQPLWEDMPFITVERAYEHGADTTRVGHHADVGYDLFNRGICLPSDIHMTHEQQSLVIEIIKRCLRS